GGLPMPRFSFSRFSSALLAMVASLAIAPSGQATPVTLAFEATVTEAGDFSQTDVPFTLESGDVLAGQLSFDSTDDLQRIFEVGVAPASEGTLRLRFKGLETFHAFNSGSPQATVEIDDSNQSNGPPSGITLSWTPTTDVFPAFSGSYQSNAEIFLIGTAGIIDELEDAVDIEKWNELTASRVLRMSFGFPG